MNDEATKERIRVAARESLERSKACVAASKAARVEAYVAMVRNGQELPPLPPDEALHVFERVSAEDEAEDEAVGPKP